MQKIRFFLVLPIAVLFSILVFIAFALTLPCKYMVPIMTNQLKAMRLWILRGNQRPRPEEG